MGHKNIPLRFTTLWIYTILKHNQPRFPTLRGFTTLWIYTILKPNKSYCPRQHCFTTLWIYTILKPFSVDTHDLKVSLPYGFTLFSNHMSGQLNGNLFHYLMDLHYSQTRAHVKVNEDSFTTLWIYTILKLANELRVFTDRFTTLWIYTILKLFARVESFIICFTTLWIYTILKHRCPRLYSRKVSLPYGFTLFSNIVIAGRRECQVSLPYGFTLFSNLK